ncbi:MAG: TIR domain-containing protein [Pseudomonadota bacterium]
MSILLEDVFKLGGIPTHTFVEPVEFNQLKVALRTPGRGLVIEGPSGIGKTTSVLRALESLGLEKKSISLSARRPEDVELIVELPRMENVGTVIIDDFHKLPDNSKNEIADYLKVLADREDKNSKIVILGINMAGRSLIQFAPDLNNRLETIRFETNPDDKVRELIAKGETALKVDFNVADEIVEASNGSFYIAQMLSHQVCLDAGILESSDSQTGIEVSFEQSKGKVFERLAARFRDCATSFCVGRRIRREGRAPYLHLLRWLAESTEWSLSIDRVVRTHPEHRGSIVQVADKGFLSELISSNEAIQSVLHYDDVSRLLTVEDPQFMYFIRCISWASFANDIGFTAVEFSNAYDFALSFAGEDRPIAEDLFNMFQERETQIFYDKNEQHRILAEDVEDYLRPIYQSEATFVIVLLSEAYPKKIWTKFESDNFKKRFHENAVIPVWFTTAPPGMFDESRKVGGLTLDPNADLEPQLKEIVNACCRKIEEGR